MTGPTPARQHTEDPVDPDVDVRAASQRRERRHLRQTLAVISLGGMVGASARYALELLLPHTSAELPWATFVTNASGSFLLGALMVLVVDRGPAHPLLRPFLGVGVLGGFTTFSSYTVQVDGLLVAGEPGLALVYLAGTLVAALVGVTLGVLVARGAFALRGRLAERSR
ncbi:MAG: fluoride efflux transporter FluC [Nocardioidaceae bacterium]